jgi:creatinine amidohydrolase
MPATRWEELSWEDLTALRTKQPLVLWPIGATEQHGKHLPTGVDTFSAESVALATSERTGVPVLPTLAYGCSLGHSPHWPGTLSLRPRTLTAIVRDVAEWVLASGFTRMVLLNGHVTNWAPLRCALEEIRHELPELRIGIRSLWEIAGEVSAWYHKDARSFHANCAETSLMLHLRPDQVRHDRITDEPDRSQCCFFSYRVDPESVSGAVGSPSQANAEEGKLWFDKMVELLSRQLERAREEGTPLEEMPPTAALQRAGPGRSMG